MSAWAAYQQRMDVHGVTRRNAALNREYNFINSKLQDNLSYHSVEIFPQEYGYNIDSNESLEHMISQNVAIINSDNYDEKTIFSLPGEDIDLGSLVHWMDNYWLVTERDANSTVYTRAKLLQCNELLKWVASDDQIIEQWCVFEDGTKYLTGYYEDKDFFTSRGDSRTSIQLARNKYTIVLGRDNRFLIDDEDNPEKMAYQLTKPMKGNLTYNKKGTYSFVLQEVVTTENDNQELGIADYYLHFPREDAPKPTPYNDPNKPERTGRWL